jgi:hypothetical protein
MLPLFLLSASDGGSANGKWQMAKNVIIVFISIQFNSSTSNSLIQNKSHQHLALQFNGIFIGLLVVSTIR